MEFTTMFAMAGAPGSGGGGAGSLLPTFLMFGAIILIFYFMIIRPQQKRMKQHQAMLSAVKRGDKVVMTGGMHGTVFEVQENAVLVEVAKNTVIRFEKGSIQSIASASE